VIQVTVGERPRKAGSGYAMHALADFCAIDTINHPVRKLTAVRVVMSWLL
jgi:hypothetical protein